MFIYVFNDDNAQTRGICFTIARHGDVPIAPRVYFPQFTDEDVDDLRDDLLSICDEYWVVGKPDESMVALPDFPDVKIRYFPNVQAVVDYYGGKPPRASDGEKEKPPRASDEEKEKPPRTFDGERDVPKPKMRTFDEILDEMVGVINKDELSSIYDAADLVARKIADRTGMPFDDVQKILYLYWCMLHDMKKLNLTEEEQKMMYAQGADHIAERLDISKTIVCVVLLMGLVTC